MNDVPAHDQGAGERERERERGRQIPTSCASEPPLVWLGGCIAFGAENGFWAPMTRVTCGNKPASAKQTTPNTEAFCPSPRSGTEEKGVHVRSAV